MPNTPISIYLSDNEYVRYVQNKKKINKKIKEMVLSEIGEGKDEDKN